MATDPSTLSTEALLAESGWLHALARQLVGDRGSADDLVQDTLVSALRRPPHVDRPLRPWLAKVARNLVRARVRSDSSRHHREAAHDPHDDTPSSAELSEKLESQHLLVEAIRELAEPYRSTILLHYWEHLSSEEIARRLDVPAGTVRWRLKQGVDALRQRLDARTKGDRRAWIALLIPLTRENTAPAATIALGALGMNVLWKASAAAAIALALAAGWWMTTEPQSASIEVPATHEAVVFEPLESAPPAVALAESRKPEREAIVEVAPEVPAAAAADTMTFEARIVGEDSRPIRGATMRVQFGSIIGNAESNTRGEVVLALATPAGDAHVRLTVRAARHVTLSRSEFMAGKPTVHLGDLVLAPGGAVSGRVQDREGTPIAGARVSLDELNVPESELAQRFRPFVDPHKEPSTRTRDDGTFLLEGVPVGFARLIAGDSAHLPGFTGIVEVRAGNESRDVVIALDRVTDDRLLRGIVLDPGGHSMGGTYVEFRTARSNGMLRTDSDGRFQTLCSPNESFELFAEDSRQRWAAVWLREVGPGADEVVMQFGEARTCAILATDSSGDALGHYAVQIWAADRSRILMDMPNESRADGRATFVIPASDFEIHIDEPMHWDGVLGPFSPAAVPPELSIRLEAAPRVHGRVIDWSGPVNGARVELYEDQRQRTTHNGFPVFVEPNSIAETLSAPDGSFALSVRGVERFHVRAEASGHAAGMVGPITVGHGAVDVFVARGGSIEGRVIPVPGQSAAGVIVGFSRGDAHAFTRRVGPEGEFRVDGLTPGPWMVERAEYEIFGRSLRSEMRSGRWDEIPSNCDVEDGRTTYFDLDLSGGAGSSTLIGELRVDGGAPGAWRVVAAPDRDRGTSDPRTVVGDGGRFRIRVGANGGYRLFFLCLSGELEGMQLRANVLVEGPETNWSFDLPTAKLELDGRASELPDNEYFVYMVSEIPPLFAAMRPLPSGEGRITLAVPAGKGALVRMHNETGPIPTSELPSFELRAGETASCRRP